MEKNGLRITFARSLFFVGAAAVVTACSGGSNSTSGILPSDGATNGAPITAPSTGLTASTSAVPFSVTAGTGPVVVQSQSGGGSCPSSNKVTLASQPAAGDLILIYAQLNDTSSTLPAPSGFSTKDAQSGNWFREAEYFKIATGSDGASYTIPSNCSGRVLSWVVADIKGADPSNPFDQHKATINNTTGVKVFTTPSLVPSHANDLPISLIATGSSGLSVSSVTPSNWTLSATGAAFTEKIYSGPATGTGAVQFSETTSSATSYAPLETLDLINPAGAASPAPTPVTSPAPTSTPQSVAGAYTYHGCVVYGPNDWFTTNLITGGSSYVSNAIDPNSANITSNFNKAWPGATFVLNPNYNPGPVNVAQSTTSTYSVHGCQYGCSGGAFNDDPNKSIPYQSNFFEQSSGGNLNCTPSGGDCHVMVMTPSSGAPSGTNPCVDYETFTTGGPSFNGSTYSAESLSVYNLRHSYDSQKSEGGPDRAGLPLLGTLDVGEDAALPSINHIAYMIAPGSDATGSSYAVGGYVTPATFGTTCSARNGSNCTYELPMGARLRLNQSRLPGGSCSSAYPAGTYPQANKICTQLATYGAVLMDHGGFSIGFGRKSDNTNPWNASDVDRLDNITINDFDVMKLGTIH